MSVRLIGYPPSVYTWAARMALMAKGVAFDEEAANPFDPEGRTALLAHQPFGYVPALYHGDVHIYETAAILDYIDAAFDGPGLTPNDPLAKARMRQVQGIVDAHGYWPLVRQVYVAEAEGDDPETLNDGLAKSRTVLAALEQIAIEGQALDPSALTLADCHLAPMIAAFRIGPQGAAMLAEYPNLTAWFAWVRAQDAYERSAPMKDAGT